MGSFRYFRTQSQDGAQRSLASSNSNFRYTLARSRSTFGGGGGSGLNFSGPPSTPAPTSKGRGAPERWDLNKVINTLVPPETTQGQSGVMQAAQYAGRAPGYILGGPIAAVGKPFEDEEGNNDFFDFLGNIPLPIPSFTTDDDAAQGEWSVGPLHFTNLRGSIKATTDVWDYSSTRVRALVNMGTAETVRSAATGDPNAPVEHSLVTQALGGVMKGLFPSWGVEEHFEARQTNGEFLNELLAPKRGWTQQDIQEILDGRDVWTFDDWKYRVSEDDLTELGFMLATDPTSYILPGGPAGAIGRAGTRIGSLAARGTGATLVRTVGPANAMNVAMAGSASALRARRGIGTLRDLTEKGLIATTQHAPQIGAALIAQGAKGAAAHATRYSLGRFLINAGRTPARIALGAGRVAAVPGKPLARMVGHGINPAGYLRAGPKGVLENYASRSTALRATELLAGKTGEFVEDTADFLGLSEEGQAFSGPTEMLRDMGYEMLSDDPLSTSSLGLLAAGFAYPGIGIIKSVGREGFYRPYREVTTRELRAGETLGELESGVIKLLDDEPSVTMRQSGSHHDKAEFEAAKTRVYSKWGGAAAVQEMINTVVAKIAWEELVSGTAIEHRVRGGPSAAWMRAETGRITQRAVNELIISGRLKMSRIEEVIRSVHGNSAGYGMARKARGAKGTIGGGTLEWDPSLFRRGWTRLAAANKSVHGILDEFGYATVGNREYITKEAVQGTLAVFELAAVRPEGGGAKIVPLRAIREALVDHPQLIGLDEPGGFWASLGVTGAQPPKLSAVKKRLTAMAEDAPGLDELFSEVIQHEGRPSGMGDEAAVAGRSALRAGETRMPHALPGEARVVASRMRQELGAAPNSLGETIALRDHPQVRAVEHNVGAVLAEAGLPVESVHQVVTGHKLYGREPAYQTTISEGATLQDMRIIAALEAEVANQDGTLLIVAGERIARAGLEPNGAVGYVRGLKVERAALEAADQILYRRHGDMYVLDDTSGEVRIAYRGVDLELARADIAETAGLLDAESFAEPGYIEYIQRESPDVETSVPHILGAASGDIRVRKFTDLAAEAFDPTGDASTLRARVYGPNAVFLRPSDRVRSDRGRSVRHGALTTEGHIRSGIIATTDEAGNIKSGLEAEHASLTAQLDELMENRRATMDRNALVESVRSDPLAPLTTRVPDEDLIPLEETQAINEYGPDGLTVTKIVYNPPSYRTGSVRVRPTRAVTGGRVEQVGKGENGAEVLREIDTETLTKSWGQDTATLRRIAEIEQGLVSTEYPRAVMFRGNIVLLDGHHRVGVAVKRNEGVVKVWLGEVLDDGRPLIEADEAPSRITLPTERESAWIGRMSPFYLTLEDMDLLTLADIRGRTEAPGRPGTRLDPWTLEEGAMPAGQVGREVPPAGEAPGTPNPEIRAVAQEYMAARGEPPLPEGQYFALDRSFAERTALEYEAMPDLDEAARPAYEAFATEIVDQWDALEAAGYKMEPWTQEGQPYANSAEMQADVRDNKHLYFFTGGDPHPFLGGPSGRGNLTQNDVFRAVHDIITHAQEGFQFGARGEVNAAIKHSQMFTPLARRAMLTETHGQNSWTNYGPHDPQAMAAPDRPYAVQKAALLPDDIIDEFERRYLGTGERLIEQRLSEVEDQVLFNRQRDIEVDELRGHLMGHRSLGSLTPEEQASLANSQEFMLRNFPERDIVHAPEIAWPVTDAVPAALRGRTMLGNWIHTYGPMSKVTAMMDWLFAPVSTARQAKLARAALYGQLIPRGATVAQVDKWLERMHEGARTIKLPGKLELRLFRDATALLPNMINEAAVQSFPPQVLQAVGADNFHLVLDRGANRFIRDVRFPGLQGGKGGQRGRLQRLVARGYETWQTGSLAGTVKADMPVNPLATAVRSAAVTKRLVSKTFYPIFRFYLDPRWVAMNYPEYNILSMLADGNPSGTMRGPKLGPKAKPGKGEKRAPELMNAEDMSVGARRQMSIVDDEVLLDIESIGGGAFHNRVAAGFVDKNWQSRSLHEIEEIINRWDEADPRLADLERLFPDNDVRPRAEKLHELMYDYDMRGVENTIVDQARIQIGKELTKEMEPLLMQLAARHKQTFEDVLEMLQGNPNRSNIERILNSYWLYWPLSYQLKAGKWLWGVLTERSFGRQTNFGGAAVWNDLVSKHQRRLMEDDEYAQFFEDHEGMFAFATMMMPMTPADMGVSLSRGVRGVGGALGWWGEYQQAKDPVSWINWQSEIGLKFTMNLVGQLWSETFGERRAREATEVHERTQGSLNQGATGGAPVTPRGSSPPVIFPPNAP